jgi:hypothetical protein
LLVQPIFFDDAEIHPSDDIMENMRPWFLFLAVFMFFSPAVAQSAAEGKPTPKGFLPSATTDWKWDRKENVYNRRTIFDYMDGSGELYLAYNLQGAVVRRYEKPGRPAIVAELYDMGSSENAYGVFSFERQDEDAGIGQGSEFGGGLLRFWKGKYFASIYAEEEGPDVQPAILALGREVARSIPAGGSAPKLLNLLPDGKAGLVPKSIRYLHSHILLNQRFFISTQNILQLTPKTEAVLAQYVKDGRKIHLLAIRYPTSKEAEAALQRFRQGFLPAPIDGEFVNTENKGWIGARTHQEYVIAAFGATGREEARDFIKATEERIGGLKNGGK